MGSGPRALTGTTLGKQYGSFYSAKAEELKVVTGVSQAGYNSGHLPHLVDANFKGMPILYFRARPGKSTLTEWDFANDPAGAGTFSNSSNNLLISAPGLTSGGDTIVQRSTADGSIIDYDAAGGQPQAAANLAWIVGNRKISTSAPPARGAFVLTSAGQDGIYYGKTQSGRANTGSGTIVNQADFDSFDDLTTAGG